MQAIITKYHGPTDNSGSRVSAKAQAGRVTIGWDDGLNSDDNHMLAATALANKFGWLDSGELLLVGGGLPDGTGNAYVLVEPTAYLLVKPATKRRAKGGK